MASPEALTDSLSERVLVSDGWEVSSLSGSPKVWVIMKDLELHSLLQVAEMQMFLGQRPRPRWHRLKLANWNPLGGRQDKGSLVPINCHVMWSSVRATITITTKYPKGQNPTRNKIT